ncbi:hybrid sensor histidine kinase/response regulator [Polaribacter sp. Hel1_85]|uniref:ATP-binding response regulator n=1 Tax=Polaribacter sp. Hel1_85 TaxID=1250005 RepID=UPI00052B9D3E|nr:ATP-binding protein [Polaribacter sp. Hel1_85]KGL63986.1 two-component system sensor histidine kinase [Polaribacter sp. Hel1_85]
MIPAKIEDVFIQLTTDYSGVIINIVAGKFAKKIFTIHESIYDSCPFLEGTLEALIIGESYLLEGMVIESESKEYNIDLELFKCENSIDVLIHNRTNVYKYVDQLNQNRNDIFFIKREIAEKNIELDELRKIADKANQEKSRFLAMMSHEIRNPLNSILGYAEMISSEKLNKKVAKYIKNLSSAGRNLKVIVDDILDLSRIEAGKLVLISEKVSIKEIIDNCQNDFQHLKTNEEVNLVFLTSEKIPEFVFGDSVRIQQILANLISNGIKFTNKGSVKTSAKVTSETENEITIIFEVADTGRGMSKEQSLKIFEEYQQNELNDNRIHGGAGLGLAIVNRLVKEMNGKVFVKSELNIGTSFFVEIPFSKISKLNRSVKEEILQEKNINLKGKKILVADDDLMNQTIVSHILKKEKAKITIVNDGLEALSKIEKETFDVVLLDINMPNMTGEELMKKKESFVKYNVNTPFLALTANTATEDIERYLELGFSSVISKPYKIANFVDKIKRVL